MKTIDPMHGCTVPRTLARCLRQGPLSVHPFVKQVASLAACFSAVILGSACPAGAATQDTIVLGNPASETAHGLTPTYSSTAQNEVMVKGSGAMGGNYGGGNISGSAVDGCHFRYQQLTGDGFIQARINPEISTYRGVKSGLMVRETLAAGSKMIFAMDNWWDQVGPGVLWRSQTDQNTPWIRQIVATKPIWMRIARAGNVFTVSYSSDGTNFTTITTQTIAMATTIQMGFAVSTEQTALFQARFDSITTSASTSWTSSDVGTVPVPGKSEIYGAGEPSRRLLPKSPVDYYGGDLVFNMAVNPNAQNYFTIKLWGSEGDGNRLILNIGDGNGNWFEVGGRHGSAIDCLGLSTGAVSSGAFWFKTVFLPRWYTTGKSSVPIRVRSTGGFYDYGTIWNYDTYQLKMTSSTRGIYRAYTHDNPVFVPAAGDVLGNAPSYETAPTRSNSGDAAYITTYKANQNNFLNGVIAAVLPTDTNLLHDKRNDYVQLARATKVTWTTAYQNSAAITKIVDYVDASCRSHYAGILGPNAEWGGSFSPQAEAIVIIAAQIQTQLNAVVDLGGGAGVTRRQQYAAMFKASRDAARMGRKTITNQAIAVDFGIYKSNLGLLAINSPDAYPDAQARRYPYESIGLMEYGGNDVSVADPSPSWSMGRGFYMTTEKGTTREGTWTSYDQYGRMAPYVFELYRLCGDTAMRDRAIQMEEAHHVRMLYASVDSEGYRAMLNEGVIACRGTFMPGYVSTVDINTTATLQSPILLGAAKQAMADGQFFRSWRENSQDVYMPDDYAKIAAAPDPGNRPMQHPSQPNSAWADEENAIVSVHANGEQHFITFYRRPGGINSYGDAHSITPEFQTAVQFWVDDVRFVDSGAATVVGPQVQTPYTGTPPDNPVSAFNGRRLPYGIDEFGQQTSGADFYSTRYGDLLIGMNCSLTKTFTFAPSGFTSGVDLISGQTKSGSMSIPPRTTVVFYSPLSVATVPEMAINPIPADKVQMVPVTIGTLSWTSGANATSHRIYFGTNPLPGSAEYKGEQAGVTYTPPTLAAGTTYFWRIDEVNSTGVKTGQVWNFTTTAAGNQTWASQDIGSVGSAGSYTLTNGTFNVTGSGNDIWGTADAFRYVYVPITGNCDIRARVASVQNTGTYAKAGVMIRETLAPGSIHVTLDVKPSGGAEYIQRSGTNATSSGSTVAGILAPQWVRIVRSGNVFTVYRSTDGLNWIEQRESTVPMTASVYAGLVVCENNNGASNTSVFDSVSVGSSAGIPTGLTGTAGPGEAAISWNAVTGATSYMVKRSNQAGGPYKAIATVLGTSFSQAGLAPGVPYYYVVSASNMFGDSLNSAAIGVTPTTATPPGATANASSSANEQPGKAFDGSSSSKWSVGVPAAWLQYQFENGASKTIASYAIISANDVPQRDPKDWQFQGSANGTTWVTLDTRTAEVFATRYQTKVYTIATPGSYAYYRLNVTANSGGAGYGLQLSELSLIPTLPSPWGTGDIGTVNAAGAAGASNGIFTVAGSGVDIWSTADSFRYVYQQASGDCSITARVTSAQNTGTWAKAGVMIRETLNANSSQVTCDLTPSGNNESISRLTTGSSSTSTLVGGSGAPYWVRLVRSGNTFTFSRSADGVNWTVSRIQTVSMSSNVYIGLPVCSASNGNLMLAGFDNVTVVP